MSEHTAEKGLRRGCLGCIRDGVDHTCGFTEPLDYAQPIPHVHTGCAGQRRGLCAGCAECRGAMP